MLLEEHPEVVLRPYWRALGYDVVIERETGEIVLVELPRGGGKLYGIAGRDGYVNMSEHDDLRLQMRAAGNMYDRAYGKPRQAAEVSAPVEVERRGLDLTLLTDDELQELQALYDKINQRLAAAA